LLDASERRRKVLFFPRVKNVGGDIFKDGHFSSFIERCRGDYLMRNHSSRAGYLFNHGRMTIHRTISQVFSPLLVVKF
jgi:hypothetical protein